MDLSKFQKCETIAEAVPLTFTEDQLDRAVGTVTLIDPEDPDAEPSVSKMFITKPRVFCPEDSPEKPVVVCSVAVVSFDEDDPIEAQAHVSLEEGRAAGKAILNIFHGTQGTDPRQLLAECMTIGAVRVATPLAQLTALNEAKNALVEIAAGLSLEVI